MEPQTDGTVELENAAQPMPQTTPARQSKPFPAWLLIGGIVLFFLGFGVSYFVFASQIKKTSPRLATATEKTPAPAKKEQETVTCPLNGIAYTPDQAKSWQDRRPLGVMIENHTDARPQSGLSKADVVYETVAEGGITRFLAVFLCQGASPVGPIRSARTFYLDWISEYDGLYTHVGGAGTPGPADALGQIKRYGILDLDEMSLGSPTFTRDTAKLLQGIASEHTAYSSTDKLWQVAKDRGWGKVNDDTQVAWDEGFVPWKFAKPAATPVPVASSSASPQTVSIPFWDRSLGSYAVKWTFDPATAHYLRTNGGIKHIDAITNEQLSAKTIVVQFMTEEPANDGYLGNLHLLYGTIGTGDAWVFVNGQRTIGTWKKNSRTDRTRYFDATGNEITFYPGKIWIEGVPLHNKQSIKITP